MSTCTRWSRSPGAPAALEPFDAILALDAPAGSYDVWLNGAKVGSLVMPAAD